MATKTAGTLLTTTLTAVVYSPSAAVLLPADVATINAAILDDQNVAHPVASQIGTGGFVAEGLLYVPNRGTLKCLPGDYICVDPATGFPILLSARAAAGASWVHS